MTDDIKLNLKADRVPCIVVGCRRTAPARFADGGDIICGPHWSMASLQDRKKLRIVKLQIVRRGLTDERRNLFFSIWGRIVRAAQERSKGL